MKIIKKISKFLIFILFTILLGLTIYVKTKFNAVSFEQLLYSLIKSKGTSFSVILGGIFYIIGFIICILLLFYLIQYIFEKIKRKIIIKITIYFKNKQITTRIFELTKRKKIILLIIYCLLSIFLTIKLLKIDEYISFQLNDSKIFELYYKDPKNVKITFPEQKKNLIFIYVESLEMTAASKVNGGNQKISYIPNLENLALDSENINFSNKENLGGFFNPPGTGWTVAAMIGQTAGVPLKVSIDGNNYKNLGGSLPGAYSLGEILNKNGYKNYIMMGSDSNFGGRDEYFKMHGDYTIFDYNWAIKNSLIPEDYYEWWGFEDSKLFEFAEDSLNEISKKDEPFNFTLLTADTHFIDGYLDESCETPFSKQYANTFHCSDSMIYKFINWVKNQDFYKDTVIIVVGDHLTMQSGFYNDKNYDRNVYNVFINSDVNASNNKNRIISSFDIFPTTLASLGATIEGNRLGFGTNLFSKVKTLYEELGIKYLDDELSKKSFFYDNYILSDTYYKMNKD